MAPGSLDDASNALERALPIHVEFHEDTGTYRASFDPRGRRASEAVISVVSIVSGSDPLELPPLHSAVDTDGLDGLFVTPATIVTPATRPRRFDGSVAFEYAGHRVTVDGYGSIQVAPVDDGRRQPPD